MIEADMQREYGIDLADELPRMSWRRFLVLVNGLGPDSAFRLSNLGEAGEAPIEDPEAIQAAFERTWGV